MNRLAICVCVCVILPASLFAQPGGRTIEGDTARFQGRFLRGMAWYELGTAQAGRIEADAYSAWHRAVQEDYGRYLMDRAQRIAARKALIHEREQDARERREALNQRWREEPTQEDLRTGVALNALASDLADPKLSPALWAKQPVPLPPEVTITALAFRFADAPRLSTPGPFSAATVAVGRMKGEQWPLSLRRSDLARARSAYQQAVAKVVKVCAEGKPVQAPAMDAVRDTLFALRDQASQRVPTSGGQRKQALTYLDRLDAATRIFLDRDIAEELIRDVETHKAATVGQLLGFMTKYRLLFDDADEDPSAWAIYKTLYSSLKEQKNRLLNALESEKASEAPPR